MSLETEEATASGFSDAGDNTVSGYKAVHWLAVVALLLGLFSLLALATSYLWFTPAIAVGVSIVAMFLTGPKQDRYSGRSLAIAGLAFGAFAMACAPAANYSRQQVVHSAAADFGESWLRLLLEDKDQVAHQYTLRSSDRQLNEDLAAIYEPSDKPEVSDDDPPSPPTDRHGEMVQLISGDVIQAMKQCGPSADIEFVETLDSEYSVSLGGDVVKQLFRIQGKGAAEPVEVVVVTGREYHAEVKKGLWRAIRCFSPEDE